MRSRVERRVVAEWLLRALLLSLLAAALWRSLEPAIPHERNVGTRSLHRALTDATSSPRVGAISLLVDSTPSSADLHWLAALAHAGVRVSWSGAPTALAIDVEGVREPRTAVRVAVAAAANGAVVLDDSAGVLDTLRVAGGGAALRATDVVGLVRARQGTYAAAAPLEAAAPPRAVLVLGRAGWESKFVLAALGETGWTVRARLPAAPGIAVTDPALLPIDTARYDVVIVLDSTAADLAPAVVRFVGAGGGLVVAGSGANLAAFRAISPALAGPPQAGRILLEGDSVTPAALPLRPLVSLRGDAVVLDRRTSGVAMAARRAGLGRVLAVGYDETWRWRMLGGASGPEAHRRWWSRDVGLVAPERGGTPLRRAAAAPSAALVNLLGPAASSMSNAARSRTPSNDLPLSLLLVMALLLLAEIASRRFRGAR